jgi:hypothetical protein
MRVAMERGIAQNQIKSIISNPDDSRPSKLYCPVSCRGRTPYCRVLDLNIKRFKILKTEFCDPPIDSERFGGAVHDSEMYDRTI